MKGAAALGFPPCYTVRGQARLPVIQHVSEAITRSLKNSMLTKDSLRMANPPTCYANLQPLQNFVLNTDPGQIGPNSPANMEPGLLIGNAARTINTTRGQSAGI